MSAPDSDRMPPRISTRVASPAVRARDAALNRVSRTRRLLITASAALSAAFAGFVSTSAPGKASPRTARLGASAALEPAPRTSQTTLRAPALPPLASASQLGLQGPTDTPQPDSGGSASPDSGGSAGSGTPSGGGDQTQAPAQPSAPAPSPAQSAPAQPSTPPGGGVVSGGS